MKNNRSDYRGVKKEYGAERGGRSYGGEWDRDETYGARGGYGKNRDENYGRKGGYDKNRDGAPVAEAASRRLTAGIRNRPSTGVKTTLPVTGASREPKGTSLPQSPHTASWTSRLKIPNTGTSFPTSSWGEMPSRKQ